MNEPRYIHDKEYHNSKSAEGIVPIIMDLFNPSSVLDIGCGTGDFLKAFQDRGVNDTLGVDGSWVDESKLMISKDHFLTADLEKPLFLNRKFDIVLCLEVAEHLQESAAETLINTLTQHSDVVIFSAAIPHQGGQNHINEQWIDYWQRLFEGANFTMHDVVRPLIWNNSDIFWWYRQNIVVCVRKGYPIKVQFPVVNNYIHPELYLSKVWEAMQANNLCCAKH